MTFTTPATIPYALERVGVLMTPDPDEPFEVEGVLNPATGWAPDGTLRIFPRLVAAGNYSRIGTGRVVVENGVPARVERIGVALEPARSWESGTGHGGTEDARITWIGALGLHVMSYVAFGPTGPRPAIAVSPDTTSWRRLGPVLFDYDDALGTDLNLFPNKDVVFFPEVVAAPDGTPCIGVLHRPMWDLGFVRPDEIVQVPTVAPDDRPSIWMSYIPLEDVQEDIRNLVRFGRHRFVAGPLRDWETVKIGAGPAPLRVPEGWLLLYHGVAGEIAGGSFQPQANVRYCAGAMILDADDPGIVRARSDVPLLVPETEEETSGAVSNVVFPTAIERIEGRDFVFFGMADSRIGVAELRRSDEPLG